MHFCINIRFLDLFNHYFYTFKNKIKKIYPILASAFGRVFLSAFFNGHLLVFCGLVLG